MVPELTAADTRNNLVSTADSLFAAGESGEAADHYVAAALTLEPGSSERLELAAKALGFATDASLLQAARILLESTDESAPYTALKEGGAALCADILPGLQAGKYRLPEYLSLMAAESILTTDPGMASLFLSFIDTLPGTAGNDLLICRYRVALGIGDLQGQEAAWREAEASSDDQLMSRLYHYRGAARGNDGIPDFIRSFSLWPAGDIHARAYGMLRDTLLADSSLAAMVIDPFYSGGLWNEVYDIAVNSSAPPARAVYLGARTRDRLGIYGEAVDLLRLYLERWPNGPDAPDAMIYLGRNLGAMGQVEEAVSTLEGYGRTWPGHRRISNLPWYIGSLLADNGLWEESIPYFRETIRRYPSNTTVDDAQFYICLALMKTGRTAEAVEAFGNFNATWTQSVYRPASRYWYGVLKLQSGDDTGRGVLERLISDKPESLPASFAREYLGLPPWQPLFTDEPLAAWMARNSRPAAQPTDNALDGVFLMEAGCRKWALDLFRAAEEEVGDVYKLAPFYLAHDVWERGPSAAWRLWSLEGDNRPLDLWRLRYPAAWAEDVVRETGRYGMDPLLLWSIMKQESAFQPTCFSTAGARGLIQMIPSTSEYVAGDNGWSDSYSPDILYEPAVSIMYGTACISQYGRDFQWDVPGTLAGYNGGPHNALRWGWENSPTEEFFSRITFNETKKYVEIVSHNYLIYKNIWPEYN